MDSDKILQKILQKLGGEHFLKQISELSGSEINSLLLEIFRLRAHDIQPAQLLTDFENNRFVAPANINTLEGKELELSWLKYAKFQGFEPVTLSPVAPLGSCSAMATVSQHKVISSLRGTEVVADATNMLALKIAQDFKKDLDKDKTIRYVTTHRHIRSQQFENPNFTAHFGIFCLAAGGFNKGSYLFELQHLNEHISIILSLLETVFPDTEMYIKFYLKDPKSPLEGLLTQPQYIWHKLPYSFVDDFENKYYQNIQFKVFLKLGEHEIDIADGGCVDWTQKLLSNQKHQLFISGIGMELVQKLKP